MCVLALLSERPTHAYELSVRFEEQGLSGVGYGTIYPLVARMRRLGLLDESAQSSPSGPARRVFTVSPAGRSALSSWVQQWLSTTSAISGLLAAVGAAPEQTTKERT